MVDPQPGSFALCFGPMDRQLTVARSNRQCSGKYALFPNRSLDSLGLSDGFHSAIGTDRVSPGLDLLGLYSFSKLDGSSLDISVVAQQR